MSNISKIIGDNINHVLKENNCSILKLSDITGLSRPTITKIINGLTIIDSEKLLIISKYFNKPFDYFLKEEHDNLSFLFRANNPKENVKVSDRSFIENEMNKIYEVYKITGEKISFIPEQYNLDLESCSGKYLSKDIEKILEAIAYEQRECLGIGDCVGTEMIKCLENKGIKIIFKKMNNPEIFGVSAFNEKKGCFIFVNDDLSIPEERKLFSVIHEYGHLIFNRKLYSNNITVTEYTNYKSDINERVANVFAGYFLIPRKIIQKYDYLLNSKSITWKDLFEIKRELKVSVQALIMALCNYGYIPSTAKSKVFQTLGKSGYLKKEPYPMDYITKNDKYINMVRNLYIKDEIGVSKVAELLGMKFTNVKNLVKEWRSDEDNIQIIVQ